LKEEDDEEGNVGEGERSGEEIGNAESTPVPIIQSAATRYLEDDANLQAAFRTSSCPPHAALAALAVFPSQGHQQPYMDSLGLL